MSRVCRCEKCFGIADVNDGEMLTSNPPQYSYDCRNCGYHGFMLCAQYLERTFEEPKDTRVPEDVVEKLKNDASVLNGPNYGVTNVYTPTQKTGLEAIYEASCPHRLPCGICRLTDKECSKLFWGQQPVVTCGDQTCAGYHQDKNTTITALNGLGQEQNKN